MNYFKHKVGQATVRGFNHKCKLCGYTSMYKTIMKDHIMVTHYEEIVE